MLFRSRLTMIVVLGCIALAGSGCGRRGALQAPPDASAARAPAQPAGVGLGTPLADPNAAADGDELDLSAISGSAPAANEAPVQTTKGAKRGYVIPKKPFILDPLL